MKKKPLYIIAGVILAVGVLLVKIQFSKNAARNQSASPVAAINNPASQAQNQQQISGGKSAVQQQAQPPQNPQVPHKPFFPPLLRASQRVTKKFFGTFVSPQNSPVQPERFTGFHTGIDYETFPEEQNAAVDINAICSGKLLLKAYGRGYGGYAVQACNLNGQPVTVVYGHLKLASIFLNAGDVFKSGDKIGILGAPYSTETDGERKHLHLGIHKGPQINSSGYVSTKQQLSGWIDPLAAIQQ